MGNPRLPFGQTRISASDLRDAVDRGRAASMLERNGVANPEARVDAFVDVVPRLLAWLEEHGRQYPWRYTTDPWRVYISEILLQRTRGDAVARVYPEFFDRFPNPEALHRAEVDEVFEVVSSLGFGNQRTRTLREVTEMCHHDHGGTVPHDLEELKRPWRVGSYSARACLMFAFGDPLALVDANIARIIERALDYDMPAQPGESDRVYDLMECLTPTDPDVARAFNLALIDLGAIACTTPRPMCQRCPVNSGCSYTAERDGVDEL